ncbi:MAG: DNA-processing protein DprA [Patescibacteria group bacterium]
MQKLTEDQKYQLAFNHFQKFGPIKMRLIENYFSDLRTAFYSSSINLEKAGLNTNLVKKFIDWRKSFNLENCLKELKRDDIKIIAWHDPEYPKLLLEIYAPPPLLYYIGDINILNSAKNFLAVVGSREHGAYANKIISELIPSMVDKRIIIVSGLAYGVDTLAHQKTLLNKGITIAVLGCGLNADIIYPYDNRGLAKEIIRRGGLLISEFPPKTGPLPMNFPQRNRIIAGLCQATLVIESKSKSGSLITAYQALDQNREVLAVPGNIYSEFSQGPNGLIKKGAKVILNSEDILEVYKLNNETTKKKRKYRAKNNNSVELFLENGAEKTIYNIIKGATEKGEKINSDEIQKNYKLDTATINSTLSILEIKDLIKNDFGNYSLY